MRLEFNLPDPDVAGTINLSTRPGQVDAWLAGLESGGEVAVARLLECMLAWNRNPVPIEHRLHLLAASRGWRERWLDGIGPPLARAPLPPDREWRARLELALRLCEEVAHMCKHVLADSGARPSRHFGAASPFDVTRELMRMLRRIAELRAAVHQPLPRGFWRDLHQAYRLAEAREWLERPAAPVEEESLAELYLSILLIELADPARMPRHELPWLFDLARLFAHLVERLPARVAPPGVFVVDLQDDSPPRPLLLKAREPGWDMSLRTTPLVRQLALILTHQALGGGRAVRDPEAVARYGQFLQRLRLRWSGARYRRGVRRRGDRSPEQAVCFGLAALAEAIGRGGEMAGFPRAHLIDSGPGGVSLSLAATRVAGIEVGDLVGFCRIEGGGWEVGVLRWFSLPAGDRLNLGVQRLSGPFMPVRIRNGERPEATGLLARAHAGRSLLLCEAGMTFSPGEALVLARGATTIRLRVRKRIEVGSREALYRVEWLDREAISPDHGG